MRKIITAVAREDSRTLAAVLGGCPLGDDVVLPAGGGDFFVAGGIGASATVNIGLGASAGGIICGDMICINWPG
ncbi:hypothetical protein Hanom_Chr05g00468591 [Helianthus anomalus]